MSYQLTSEEKINIITQHLRTLGFARYNLEVSLMEEQAVNNPSEDTVNSLGEQIGVLDAKIEALVAEALGLQQGQVMNSKESLIITALQQRIGELSAEYELKIAMLRAEITSLIDLQKEKEEAAKEYSKSIESILGENNG